MSSMVAPLSVFFVPYFRAGSKGGNGKGVFAFVCQCIVSLRRRTGNCTAPRMWHLVEGWPNCTWQSCQCTVGTCGHNNIVLTVIPVATQRSLPLFAYPLFIPARYLSDEVKLPWRQCYDRVRAIETDWNWLKVIENDRKWLKMTESDRKLLKVTDVEWKSMRMWGKAVEGATNELLRFRTQGGPKQHLRSSESKCPLVSF